MIEGMPPILNAQSLSKAFGAEPLFRNVSFTVNERDRIALIGPNGSGKSTLLRILAGLVPPDAGEVALRKRATLAYVPQESVFAPGLSVTQVIEAALDGLRRFRGWSATGDCMRRLDAPALRTSRPRRNALRRLAQAAGYRRSAGHGAGDSAARRANQPSRPGRDRVARRAFCSRPTLPASWCRTTVIFWKMWRAKPSNWRAFIPMAFFEWREPTRTFSK